MAYTIDRDGQTVSYQPTKKRRIDFTSELLYSRSAIAVEGYFDIPTELGVPFAFVKTSTAGDLKVQLLDDSTAGPHYFATGENSEKVKRIYYVADNDFNVFDLIYCPRLNE